MELPARDGAEDVAVLQVGQQLQVAGLLFTAICERWGKNLKIKHESFQTATMFTGRVKPYRGHE